MKVLNATPSRLTIIDVLRGYFLFAIVINHIRLFPNLFIFVTGETRLWVSFAEGFFFISGFILAYLFCQKKIDGLGIFKKSWSRMLKIYLWSVVLTLSITAISNLLPIDTAKDGLWIIDGSNLLKLTGDTLTFRYIYGYADFLPYYAIFLFFSPFVFVLLKRFGAYFVLFASLLTWVFRGSNVYMAQQVMFVLGILFGYNFNNIKRHYLNISLRTKSRLIKTIIALFIVTFGICIFSTFILKGLLYTLSNEGVISEIAQSFLLKKNDILNLQFDKHTLGGGRLILAPLWYGALLIFFTKFENTIRNIFGGVFERWGRNSLFIFITHSLLVIPIPLVMKYLPSNFLTNSVVSFLILVLIDKMIRLKNKYLPYKTILD